MEQQYLIQSKHRVDVSLKTPCVYESYANDWDLKDFTDQLLYGKFSNFQTMFRVGALCSSSSSNSEHKTVRECESMHLRASFRQFHSWLSGNGKAVGDIGDFHNLPSFDDHKVFAYADYKHFIELFAKESGSDDDVEEDVVGEETIPRFGNWQGVGLEGIDSSQCTLWLGSLGSHTVLPCCFPCKYITI